MLILAPFCCLVLYMMRDFTLAGVEMALNALLDKCPKKAATDTFVLLHIIYTLHYHHLMSKYKTCLG